MSIRLGVLGASGRAGGLVIRCLSEFPEFVLGAALVAPDCKTVGTVCLAPGSNGEREVRYSTDMAAAQQECDVFIDFSMPSSSLALAKLCATNRKPIVVATTGFKAEQLAELRKLGEATAVLVSPNMSLGVFAMRELCLLAQDLLGQDFQVEVFEIHHDQKRDAPSGTALGIGSALARKGGLAEVVRGEGIRGKAELGYASVRGGDVVGEHTVFFFGKGERVELSHRASDRAIFARGALRAALKLRGCKPGFYTMNDLYGATTRKD